jgi:hypothetical protein
MMIKTHKMKTAVLRLLMLAALMTVVAPVTAQTLLDENFSSGFDEWTVVHPPGAFNGSTRWQADVAGETLFENSNVRAPGSAGMLINNAKTGENFTYKALLLSGDDDGIGLVFGYKDSANFYRIIFAAQPERNTFPGEGWLLERVTDGSAVYLAGDDYSEDWEPDFIYMQGFPFEVTIKAKGKKLTIVVVDDPEEDGTEYELLTNMALPKSVAGNVGLASWEQAGGIPSGSHFSDISVDGKEVAMPNPLDGWEEVIPLNYEENDLLEGGNEGYPLWSVGLTIDSSAGGILTESSNSGLIGTEIEMEDEQFNSNIDWVSGMLVTGDAKWKDYRISTKLHPYPFCAFTGCWVNGHGLVFRYKDPENFYRLSFSSRNPGDSLPRQGVSIQKVVNGEWSEVFWEKGAAFSTKKFVPSGKTDQSEFNLTLSIIGNQLEFTIVNDPDGTAKVFNYGPIEISGVDSGKVGFFSWYQHKLDIHHIKVEEIAGMPFEVFSNFGEPSPPAGLTNFEPGTKVLATVPSPIVDPPGFRRKVTGWSGTGSAPKGGIWFLPGNPRVSFVINQASSLTWNWSTEVKVNITADDGGKVSGGSSKWYKEGTKLILTALPSSGFMFDGWYGSVSSKNKKLTTYTDRPLDLTAVFRPDSDRDGMDDDWEKNYIGNLSGKPDGDNDGDGVSNMDEYRRRTNPAEAEVLVYEVPSNWENPGVSNPYTVGRMIVADFGKGYSGIWENSGTFRGASAENEFTDWKGQKLIMKESVWKEDWKDGVYEATFVVGDIDTSCLYFRYQDEDNWYRASLSARDADGAWPQAGLSIQKKVNGAYELIEEYDDWMLPDPEDDTLKIIKLKVSAKGNSFTVQAIPYDPFDLDDFDEDAASEKLVFKDDALATGRAGIGFAHQGGGDTATDDVPVGAGALLKDMTVTSGNKVVFQDSWEGHDSQTLLPNGWTDPAKGGGLAGGWVSSAHGGFVQMKHVYTASPTSKNILKADAEGALLIGPTIEDKNFLLEFGFVSHTANDYLTAIDGLGFVYDYKDENNYARVIVVNTMDMALDGGSTLPRGINVSRKIDGNWHDIIIGDRSFSYVRGRPFDVAFTAENGNYHLVINGHEPLFLWNQWRNSYFPATPSEIQKGAKSAELHWSDQEATAGNRYGVTTWGSRLANILKAEQYSLEAKDSKPPEPAVLAVSQGGGKVTITWDGDGQLETSTSVTGPWTEISGSSPAAITPAGNQGFYRVKR